MIAAAFLVAMSACAIGAGVSLGVMASDAARLGARSQQRLALAMSLACCLGGIYLAMLAGKIIL